MYILPWHDVIISGNLTMQQGPPVTRADQPRAGDRRQPDDQPRTARQHPARHAEQDSTCRVGKLFRMKNARSLELTLDLDNLANSATVWQVRTLTPSATFTDPTTGTRATLQQFMSPVQILGPRTVVLRAAFKF